MADQIYVALLDEGTDVWRPVPAWKVGSDRYVLLRPDDYDPQLEQWEFPPGSVVAAEPRTTPTGEIIAAVRAEKVQATLRSA